MSVDIHALTHHLSEQITTRGIDRANLSNVPLVRTNLTSASFERCNLSNAYLHQCVMEKTKFNDCQMWECHLSGVNLSLPDSRILAEKCNFVRVMLRECDLSNASISRCKLDDVYIDGIPLQAMMKSYGRERWLKLAVILSTAGLLIAVALALAL